jgi:hypothetical protein
MARGAPRVRQPPTHQRSPARRRYALARGWSPQLVASLDGTGISFDWSVDVTNAATGQIGDYYPTAISNDGRPLGETGRNMLSPAARVLCVLAVVAHTNLACDLDEKRRWARRLENLGGGVTT